MSGFDLRIIDAILALIAFEALVVLSWRAWTGSGPQPAPLLATLIAGGGLLIALREALAGASAAAISAALAVSFVAHVFDLAARWMPRRGRGAEV